MKIQPIRTVNLSVNGQSLSSAQELRSDLSGQRAKGDLRCMPCYYPITFSGGDMTKVRKLFQYGIPDMYSDRITIDPKMISKWLKSGLFSKPAGEVVSYFDEKYATSFVEQEFKALDVIRERAKIHPNYTMREILQEVRPVFSRRLRKKQTPIFHELWEEFQKLPKKYSEPFGLLLQKTDKMLNDKPVVIPFSSYEFKYKLAKIKDYVEQTPDPKAKKVMNKLMKESMKFSNSTNSSNIDYQKEVFSFLNHIRKKSVLKNNEQLKQLFEETRSRLNKKEVLIPFQRKSFIYDVAKIIDDLPSKRKQEKIIKIASQLPTSSESFSAYLLKISTDSNDKIGYRLVWPSMATIEHILPRSKGGTSDLANLGIASAIENSNRKNIDFHQQLKLCPQIPRCTQKTIDRLIELYNEGIFNEIHLSPKYITGYANTVYEQSKHRVKLDTSKLAA